MNIDILFNKLSVFNAEGFESRFQVVVIIANVFIDNGYSESVFVNHHKRLCVA